MLSAQDLATMPTVLDACAFATRMHGNQRRKYTGEPYVLHCLEVARMVAEIGGTPTMIVAALLHDVVEDTEASIQDVRARFGEDIAQGVAWLTDVSRPEDGNRAVRKAMDRDHLAQATAMVLRGSICARFRPCWMFWRRVIQRCCSRPWLKWSGASQSGSYDRAG